MPRKLIVLSCLLTVVTFLSISTAHLDRVRAQADDSASTDWEYPGAQGSWNGRSAYLTTGMFWTDDDFKMVLRFYAARAGFDTQNPRNADLIERPGYGVALIGDATIVFETVKSMKTAVITRRSEHQTISAHITREPEENGRTTIILVREGRTARKFAPPVPLKERVAEFIRDARQWASPGAEPVSAAGGDNHGTINYRSPESLSNVLNFYTGKVGATPAPDFFTASSNVIAVGDHAIASTRRSDLHGALFLKQTAESLYAVLVSRAPGEEQTHFTLMSITGDAPASSPPDDQTLSEWEPKAARLQKSAVAGARRIATYSTQESFKSVAEAYAVQLGAKLHEEFETRSSVSGIQGGFLLNNNRPAIQNLVVFKRMEKYALFLLLSHGVNESETDVTVMLQGR